jgi:hypothetical protein
MSVISQEEEKKRKAAEKIEAQRRQAEAEKLTAETQATANVLGDLRIGQKPKQLDLAELNYSGFKQKKGQPLDLAETKYSDEEKAAIDEAVEKEEVQQEEKELTEANAKAAKEQQEYVDEKRRKIQEEAQKRQAQAEKQGAATQKTANKLGEAGFGQQPQFDISNAFQTKTPAGLLKDRSQMAALEVEAQELAEANVRAAQEQQEYVDKKRDAYYLDKANNIKTSNRLEGMNATGAFTGAGSFDKYLNVPAGRQTGVIDNGLAPAQGGQPPTAAGVQAPAAPQQILQGGDRTPLPQANDIATQAAQAGGQAPAAPTGAQTAAPQGGGNIATHGAYTKILDFSQQSVGDENEVVAFGGKPIKRGDYNKLQGSMMALVTSSKRGEASTKELTDTYGKAMNKAISSPNVQALLSNKGTDWKTIGTQIREEYLNQTLDAEMIEGLRSNKGNPFLKSFIEYAEKNNIDLTKLSIRQLRDTNNLQNFVQSFVDGGAAKGTGVKFRIGDKLIEHGVNGKGNNGSIPDVYRAISEGLPVVMIDEAGAETVLTPDNIHEETKKAEEAYKDFRTPKAKENGETFMHVMRGEEGASFDIEDVEFPEAEKTTTVRAGVSEPYRGQFIWDFTNNASRPGHASNAQIAQMWLGNQQARQELINQQNGGIMREELTNKAHALEMAMTNFKASYATVSDPHKRQQLFDKFKHDILKNPQYNPVAYSDPRMKLAMNSLVQQEFQVLERQMVEQSLEMQREAAIADASNKISGSIARVQESGQLETEIGEIVNALAGQQQYLSPLKLNQMTQQAFSDAQDVAIQHKMQKVLEDSAGLPIYDVGKVLEEASGEVWKAIGAAEAFLGDDQLDILRVSGAETMGKASKSLYDHNLNYLQGLQAKYENSLNEMDMSTANAIRDVGLKARKRMLDSGALGTQGEWASRDWFKPVKVSGTKGSGSAATDKIIDGQIKAVMPSVLARFDGAEEGISVTEAIDAIYANYKAAGGGAGESEYATRKKIESQFLESLKKHSPLGYGTASTVIQAFNDADKTISAVMDSEFPKLLKGSQEYVDMQSNLRETYTAALSNIVMSDSKEKPAKEAVETLTVKYITDNIALFTNAMENASAKEIIKYSKKAQAFEEATGLDVDNIESTGMQKIESDIEGSFASKLKKIFPARQEPDGKGGRVLIDRIILSDAYRHGENFYLNSVLDGNPKRFVLKPKGDGYELYEEYIEHIAGRDRKSYIPYKKSGKPVVLK